MDASRIVSTEEYGEFELADGDFGVRVVEEKIRFQGVVYGVGDGRGHRKYTLHDRVIEIWPETDNIAPGIIVTQGRRCMRVWYNFRVSGDYIPTVFPWSILTNFVTAWGVAGEEAARAEERLAQAQVEIKRMEGLFDIARAEIEHLRACVGGGYYITAAADFAERAAN